MVAGRARPSTRSRRRRWPSRLFLVVGLAVLLLGFSVGHAAVIAAGLIASTGAVLHLTKEAG